MEAVTGLVVRLPAPPVNADGDEVLLRIVARDPNAAPLTFSATGLPPGLSMDPMTGLISGMLSHDASASSPYTVNTTVSSGADLNGVTFVWTVTNPEPILALPFVPVDSLPEGTAVSLQAEASDPDGDPLVFSASGLPPGLSMNTATGLISGTLSQTAASGSPYMIIVTVLDGQSSTSLDFILMVTNPEPILALPFVPLDSFPEGAAVSLQAEASDPDGDPLVFSASGLPPGLSMNTSTGLISGTLSQTAASGSPYMIIVTVSDGQSNTSLDFILTVVNPVPVIVFPGDQSSIEGASMTLQIEASDPDGDPLVFSASGLPPGLSINASTGLISGTLSRTAAAGSPYMIIVMVSDGQSSTSVSFTLTVTNPAPVIASPGDQTSLEGASVALQIEASDPDGDPLVFSASGLPPGLSINSSTGLISGTIGATAADGSPYTVIAGVSDGVDSIPITFTWVVNPILPLISIADQTVVESNTAGAVFLVSLSTVTGRTVTVDFETDNDSATAGQDYRAVSGRLSFDPGVTTQMLTVPLINDMLDEPSETFVVNLRNANNGELADARAVGTIQDDDAAPSLSINNVTVAEGDSGTTAAVFTVTLSAMSGRTVRVDYSTDNGTAIAGDDYQAASDTLVFSPGDTTQMLTVLVIGDLQLEQDETFVVNLSNADNATIADGQGVGTITNDDVAPQLSINDVTVTEGNIGTTPAVFTVTLSPPTNQTVTVNFSTAATGNTATPGQDFLATSGTLTFVPAVATQTLSVSVVGDLMVEPNETFLVNLSGADNAEIADAQGVGTISNDDVVVVIASEGTDEILRFDAKSGAWLGTLVADNPATPEINENGGVISPGHLVLGPNHQLYVASQMTDEILLYDAETGEFLDVLVGDDPATSLNETGGLALPGHLLLGPDHQLYVVSQMTDEILLYNADTGAFLGVLVGRDATMPNQQDTQAPRGLSSMAFGPDGSLYVSRLHTNQILSYDSRTGDFLNIVVGDDPKTLTVDESAGLRGPSSMVCCPDTHLYVASQHTHEILRYDSRTGTFIDTFVPVSSGGLLTPGQFLFGPDRHLYVSSLHTQQVLRYDGRTGAFLGVSVHLAVHPDPLPNPMKLIFMPEGRENR